MRPNLSQNLDFLKPTTFCLIVYYDPMMCGSGDSCGRVENQEFQWPGFDYRWESGTWA